MNDPTPDMPADVPEADSAMGATASHKPGAKRSPRREAAPMTAAGANQSQQRSDGAARGQKRPGGAVQGYQFEDVVSGRFDEDDASTDAVPVKRVL